MPCSHCGKIKVHAKGFCGSCYDRFIKSGSPEKTKKIKVESCSFCGRVQRIRAHGLCGACYKRYRSHGTAERVKRKKVTECAHCKAVETIKARELCQKCYDRFLHHGSPEYIRKRNICSEEDCSGFVVSHGLCGKHAMRKRREEMLLKESEYLYQTWSGMLRRCYDKNHFGYPYYGSKGITVCDRWKDDFHAFVEDMGDKPASAYSIDRIDSNKGYYPENCRWSTKAEQSQNKADTVLNADKVEEIRERAAEGEAINDLAIKYGCCKTTIWKAIKGETWANAKGPIRIRRTSK